MAVDVASALQKSVSAASVSAAVAAAKAAAVAAVTMAVMAAVLVIVTQVVPLNAHLLISVNDQYINLRINIRLFHNSVIALTAMAYYSNEALLMGRSV